MIGEAKGKLVSNTLSDTGKWLVTFETEQALPLSIEGDIKISVEEWKEKRSVSANSLLWKCLSQIAQSLPTPTDIWSVYIEMLKSYSGKFHSVLVLSSAVDDMKRMYRATEVVGTTVKNGVEYAQLNCYIGSSEMNTAEFSKFVDGVISEMDKMGLETPEQRRLRLKYDKP